MDRDGDGIRFRRLDELDAEEAVRVDRDEMEGPSSGGARELEEAILERECVRNFGTEDIASKSAVSD